MAHFHVDKRNKFKRFQRLVDRNEKIAALAELKTSEARKEHKGMFTFRIGRTKVNTTGFFEPAGKHPVRCKAKSH